MTACQTSQATRGKTAGKEGMLRRTRLFCISRISHAHLDRLMPCPTFKAREMLAAVLWLPEAHILKYSGFMVPNGQKIESRRFKHNSGPPLPSRGTHPFSVCAVPSPIHYPVCPEGSWQQEWGREEGYSWLGTVASCSCPLPYRMYAPPQGPPALKFGAMNSARPPQPHLA